MIENTLVRNSSTSWLIINSLMNAIQNFLIMGLTSV